MIQLGDIPSSKLGAKYFEQHTTWITPILGEVDFTNTREITCRYLLSPGHYVLVPSTFDPDVGATYLLRMYAWTNHFECQCVKYLYVHASNNLYTSIANIFFSSVTV